MRAHGFVDRLTQVVPQVPAVGDLHRLPGSDAGCFGVGAGPVAAEDRNARMLLEPGRDRVRGAVGQHVQGPVRLDVDHGVPYRCPRRNAKSSIPTALSSPATGSGMARTRRSIVVRLTGTASRWVSRAPGAAGEQQRDRLQHRVQ